jgi:hypothetical protein
MSMCQNLVQIPVDEYPVMNRLFVLTCLASLASLGIANAAQAFQVVTAPTNDAGFNSLLTSGQMQEVYVAGGRAGNNSATGGERETEILDDLNVNFTSGYPGTIISNSQNPVLGGSGQRTWVKNELVDFSLVYNPNATGATPKLTFTVAGSTPSPLTTNQFSGQVTDLFFRVRAGSNNVGTYSSSFSNLVLDGVAVGQDVSASCTRATAAASNCSDVKYLRLSGLNSNGFNLTGKTSFNWGSGAMPTNSNMMFQIKAAAPGPRPVPAPAMMAGMVLTGAGTLWKKLKSKR